MFKPIWVVVSALVFGAVILSGCTAGAGSQSTAPESGSAVASSSSTASTGSQELPHMSSAQAQRLLLTGAQVPKGYELSDDTVQTFNLRNWRSYIDDSLEVTKPKSCQAAVNSGSLLSDTELTTRPQRGDKIVSAATINDAPDVNYAIYQTLRVFSNAAAAEAFVTQRQVDAARCQAVHVVTSDDNAKGTSITVKAADLNISGVNAWSLAGSRGTVRVNSLRSVGNVVIALDVVSNDPDVNAKSTTLEPLWNVVDAHIAEQAKS